VLYVVAGWECDISTGDRFGERRRDVGGRGGLHAVTPFFLSFLLKFGACRDEGPSLSRQGVFSSRVDALLRLTYNFSISGLLYVFSFLVRILVTRHDRKKAK
jgi:hypothetical protein